MNVPEDHWAKRMLYASVGECREEIVALLMINYQLHEEIRAHPRAFRKRSAIRRQIRANSLRADYIEWCIAEALGKESD